MRLRFSIRDLFWLTLATVGIAPMGCARHDAAQEDLNAIQGTWAVVLAEHGGEDGTMDFRNGPNFVFQGDAWLETFAGYDVYDASNSHIKLDPTQSPKTIDHIVTRTTPEGQSVKIVYPGIYELDGDSLKLCYDVWLKARPKNFKTTPGNNFSMLTLKRVKEDKKK